MIEYVHSKGYKIVLYTTLVGLKSENVKRLQICNPEVVLHLPDNKDNAKIPISENYKDTLVTVMKLLRVTNFSMMNDQFISNERAGLCLNIPERRVHGWFYCAKLLHPEYVMLPNCDVVLCCMDFGLKHRLGNLLEQSFNDIVNSKEYKRVLDGRFKTHADIICRKCLWAVPLHKWYAGRLIDRVRAL
jgi:radical SAM protein with 4Fe4S-binding SPASM domain